MDKKDIKKFEELYWKEDESAVRTFEDIEAKLRDSRNFYLKELAEERKKADFENAYRSNFELNAYDKEFAEKFVHDINLAKGGYSLRFWILTNGMYESYKTGDMSVLKNALHTMNRLMYGNTLITCSGVNQAGNFERVIYAFADCDIDLAKKYFPKIHGLADNNAHPFAKSCCNLIMGMIYKNSDWEAEAQQQAQSFNQRKSSAKSDVLVVDYLLALSKRDDKKASILIQEIANSYRKMTWLFNFNSEFLKFFGVFVHGLYNIAHFVLDKELFSQIKIPEHSVFWKEFDLYTKEHHFSKGELIFKFDNELETVKRLFDN